MDFKIARYLKSKNLLRILGLLIFVVILTKIDVGKLALSFRDINFKYLVLGALVSLPLFGTRAFRWNRIKKSIQVNSTFRNSLLLQIIGGIGFATPGRLGEFVKALYLKEQNQDLSASVLSIIFDRIFDLMTIVSVAFFGFLWFHNSFQNDILSKVIVIFFGLSLIFGAVILLTGRSERTQSLFLSVLEFLLPEKLKSKVSISYYKVIGYLKLIKPKQGVGFLGLSLLSFSVQVLRIQMFTFSLNLDINFFYLSVIVAVMVLANMIPVTISGLGTRDAVFIYFLSVIGISKESAVSLSMIILGFIVLQSLIGGIIFMVKPVELNFAQFANKSVE